MPGIAGFRAQAADRLRSEKCHFQTLANSVVQRRPKAALILGLSARLDSWR
jgi:hypothetical protein